VLGAVLVFPLLVDGNAEVASIAVRSGLLFGVFAEVAFEVDVFVESAIFMPAGS
jgi:hypothetical protein